MRDYHPRRSKKSLDRLKKEAMERDMIKVKQGTHRWEYDPKQRANVLKPCIQEKK